MEYKARLKWEAWSALKDLSSAEAKERYVKKVYHLLSPFHSLVHSPQSEKTLTGESVTSSETKLPEEPVGQKIRDFISAYENLTSPETQNLHASFEAVFKHAPPQRSKSPVGLAEAIELAKSMDFSDNSKKKSPFDESLLGLAGSRLVYMDPKKSVASRENTMVPPSHKKILSTASTGSTLAKKSKSEPTSSSESQTIKDIQSRLKDMEHQVKYLEREKAYQERRANTYGWLALGTAVASVVYHDWNSPQSWLRSKLLSSQKRS